MPTGPSVPTGGRAVSHTVVPSYAMLRAGPCGAVRGRAGRGGGRGGGRGPHSLTHTMKRSHSAHLGVSEATGRLLTLLLLPVKLWFDVEGAGEGAEGATAAAEGWGEQARPPTAWLCVAKYVVEAGRSADRTDQHVAPPGEMEGRDSDRVEW